MKENEFIQWRKEQKRLLDSEINEENNLKQSKKRLKRIKEEIKKNNNWLRQNVK